MRDYSENGVKGQRDVQENKLEHGTPPRPTVLTLHLSTKDNSIPKPGPHTLACGTPRPCRNYLQAAHTRIATSPPTPAPCSEAEYSPNPPQAPHPPLALLSCLRCHKHVSWGRYKRKEVMGLLTPAALAPRARPKRFQKDKNVSRAQRNEGPAGGTGAEAREGWGHLEGGTPDGGTRAPTRVARRSCPRRCPTQRKWKMSCRGLFDLVGRGCGGRDRGMCGRE